MYNLVYANEKGDLFDYPDLIQTGRLGNSWVEPLNEEYIPLPEGATLTMVPDRYPLGINPQTGDFKPLLSSPDNKNEKIYAVAALLPQGYTRILLPGYITPKEYKILPLFGYTAVAIKNGKFYVAAIKTDEDYKWNPSHFNTDDLEEKVNNKLKINKNNRIIKQLAKCSLEYGCFTAENIFYGRWEGGIPSSPICNARCLGCISLQPAECCPSPQSRIDFVPTVEEISEIGIAHLNNEESIISFGQGCEGEPSLQAKTLAKAIKEIRNKTKQGTININTNAGYTEGIKELVDAGLNAMRISIISANEEVYNAYYRPIKYTLQNVKDSIKYATDNNVYSSLNLLTIPGLNDREEEIEALIDLVKETKINSIQIRNLNIDPDQFLNIMPKQKGEVLGIISFLKILKDNLPDVQIGNYSKPVYNHL